MHMVKIRMVWQKTAPASVQYSTRSRILAVKIGHQTLQKQFASVVKSNTNN